MTTKIRCLLLSATVMALYFCLPNPAGAFELFPRPEGQYTVKRADSLYGLSGLYYGNPTLWPFLWNHNPQVKVKEGKNGPQYEDIKPGTKIDLYHSQWNIPMLNQTYLPPNGIPEEARFLVQKIPYQGIPYDKKYFRFKLGLRPTQMWGYVASGLDPTKTHFLERDLLYLNLRPGKRQCVLVGDRFGIYREDGPLRHPLNPEREVGYIAQVVGEVEVVSTGHNLITAIVLESYEEPGQGDKICLFVPRQREIVPSKTHRLLTGTIIVAAGKKGAYTDASNLENDLLFIDRGQCDGMKEGMLLNIYRAGEHSQDPYTYRNLPLPDRYVGEGMVLKTFDKNSTVIITKSREEVIVGDVIKTVSD